MEKPIENLGGALKLSPLLGRSKLMNPIFFRVVQAQTCILSLSVGDSWRGETKSTKETLKLDWWLEIPMLLMNPPIFWIIYDFDDNDNNSNNDNDNYWES